MLNAYPDSLGGRLSDIVNFLQDDLVQGCFESLYCLPSVFNTDLDRGFSVIDYELNDLFASKTDLEALKALGIDLKFDFILNHASVLSKEFQDIIKHGERSPYVDFFIDWNKFWAGHGQMNEEGFIEPYEALIQDMFFRKPGLPILKVRFPSGEEVPYWNTFYQEVKYNKIDTLSLMKGIDIQFNSAEAVTLLVNGQLDLGIKPSELAFGQFDQYREQVIDFIESKRNYLGQMDLNIKSPLVWKFYEETLNKLSDYGAQIVRLDAFAYAPKAVGERNFFNEPGTWEVLDRLKIMADQVGVKLLPEIHTSYKDKMHEKIAEKGFMTYDFFLPGLIIDAFENHNAGHLKDWIQDIVDQDIKTVNMLGCHDGIPLLDLKGILKDEQIENLINIVVDRGGYVKDLHGKKNLYYQVNATYYSALGEDDAKLLLARAIQMFMPGKPQVWYLDLFAGKNDHEAVVIAGEGGHKEINRTNLTKETIAKGMKTQLVQDQLELLKFRNEFPAFGFDAQVDVLESSKHQLTIRYKNNGHEAILYADLLAYTYRIEAFDSEKRGIEI